MKRMFPAVLCLVLVAAASADPHLDKASRKAAEQLQKGEPDEAVKTLQKAAAQANTSEAHLALASLQRRVGQPEAAAASTQRAVALASSPADKASAFAALSALHLREGKGKDALAEAQRAVAAQETAVSLAALARAHTRLEDLPAALATVEKALRAGAGHAAVLEAQGDVLLAAGQPAEAVSAYRSALAADPAHSAARAALATALSAQGQHAEAVKEARAAVAADASSSEAHSALADALFAQDPKQWNDAIGAAQEAVRLNPKSVAAHLSVARLFVAEGNLKQAHASFGAVLALDPDHVPALLDIVRLQAAQGKYAEALAAAQALVKARPDSPSANLVLGTMLVRRSAWTEAVPVLRKATASDAATAEAWALLGMAFHNTSHPADAVAAYERAVQRDPGNTSYRSTYGLLLGIAGQRDRGVAELRKIVQDPAYKDADAWINLGWLYRRLEPQRPKEAVAAYETALTIDPANGQALLGLGWAHYYAGNPDAAIQAFEKTAEAEETLQGMAYNGAAWSYLLKKNAAQADAFRKKAEAGGGVDRMLAENIDRVQRGLDPKPKRADKGDDAPVRTVPVVTVDTVLDALSRGTAHEKIKAARQCKKFGTACLDTLVAALHYDANQNVKIAAANAIGAMGTAGKKADPQLRKVLDLTKCPEIVPTPDCLKREASMAGLQKAVEAALRSVNGL